MLRVKSIEGEQGSDIVFYHGYNYDERYSPACTVNLNKHNYPGLGGGLHSTCANKFVTITAGAIENNDCICGSRPPALNRMRCGNKAEGKCTGLASLEDPVVANT